MEGLRRSFWSTPRGVVDLAFTCCFVGKASHGEGLYINKCRRKTPSRGKRGYCDSVFEWIYYDRRFDNDIVVGLFAIELCCFDYISEYRVSRSIDFSSFVSAS
jgi:hypothetical protein